MGDATLLYGDGGTGKSLVALQLAVASATGTNWLSQSTRAGSVLYLSAEDDEDELHRRLNDVTRAAGVRFPDLHDFTLRSLAGEDALLGTFPNRTGKLVATGLFREIEAEEFITEPKLIVLDTLNDLFGGDENDKAQARQFIQLVRGLALRIGSAVVLLARPSKSGMAAGGGDSGSVAWSNSVRSRLYLTRDKHGDYEPDPDVRVLTTMKANYGPKGGELRVRWTKGAFEPVGANAASGEDITAKTERVFLKLLKVYNANGQRVNKNGGPNYAPTVFAQDADAEGVRKEAFAKAMKDLLTAKKIETGTERVSGRNRHYLVEVSQTQADTPAPAA